MNIIIIQPVIFHGIGMKYELEKREHRVILINEIDNIMSLTEEFDPDLIIMDTVFLRNYSNEVLYNMKKCTKGLRIWAIELSPNTYIHEKLKETGFDGCIPSNISSEAFFDVLEENKTAWCVGPSLFKSEKNDRIGLLSPREKEVFCILADGKSYKEIAQELVISEKTVLTHRLNIIKKLGLKDQMDLIRFAARMGYTSL